MEHCLCNRVAKVRTRSPSHLKLSATGSNAKRGSREHDRPRSVRVFNAMNSLQMGECISRRGALTDRCSRPMSPGAHTPIAMVNCFRGFTCTQIPYKPIGGGM